MRILEFFNSHKLLEQFNNSFNEIKSAVFKVLLFFKKLNYSKNYIF